MKRLPAALSGTLFAKVTAAQYHADPCLTPSLSASIAHTMTSQSPLHGFTSHPRLGGVPYAPTTTTERGELFHALLLHEGKAIEVVPADDWKTKAAQDARKAAREARRIAVLERVFDDAQSGCRIIEGRLADLGVVLDYKRSELGMFWIDHTTSGEPVQCRALIDNWVQASATEYDLKSCARLHPETIANVIADYGAHVQRAAYRRGLEANVPKLAGRIRQRLIFFETAPPFDVAPVRIEPLYAELGAQLWQRALDTWAECMSSGHWPGMLGELDELTVSAPLWYLKRFEDRT